MVKHGGSRNCFLFTEKTIVPNTQKTGRSMKNVCLNTAKRLKEQQNSGKEF